MNNHNVLPPGGRTPIWRHITKAAESGEFRLQVCQHCQSVQYPPRELCKDCLHDELEWQKLLPEGEIISYTSLHASTSAFFRENLPRQIALVKMDCGPVMFTHAAYDDAKTGDSVTITNKRDLSGEGVFISLKISEDKQRQLSNLSTILLQD